MNPHPSKNFQSFADNVRKIILRPSGKDKSPFSFVLPLKTMLWSVEKKGQGLCMTIKNVIMIRTDAWNTIKLTNWNTNRKFINTKATKHSGLAKVLDYFLYLPEEPRRSCQVSNKEQLVKVGRTIAKNISKEVGTWRLKSKKPKRKGQTASQLKTSMGNTGQLKRRKSVRLITRIPQQSLRVRNMWTAAPTPNGSTAIWKPKDPPYFYNQKSPFSMDVKIPPPRPYFKSDSPCLDVSLQGTVWGLKVSLSKIPLKLLKGTYGASDYYQGVPPKRKINHDWTCRQSDISINFIGWGYVPGRRCHLASQSEITSEEGSSRDNALSGMEGEVGNQKTAEATISQIKGPADLTIVVKVPQGQDKETGQKITIGLKKNGEMLAQKDVSIDLGNRDFAEYFSSNSIETECSSLGKKTSSEEPLTPSNNKTDYSKHAHNNGDAIRLETTAKGSSETSRTIADSITQGSYRSHEPKNTGHEFNIREISDIKSSNNTSVLSTAMHMNSSQPGGQLAEKLHCHQEKSSPISFERSAVFSSTSPNKLFHFDDHSKQIDACHFNLNLGEGQSGCIGVPKDQRLTHQQIPKLQISHVKLASDSQPMLTKYPMGKRKNRVKPIGDFQTKLKNSDQIRPPNPPWKSQRYAYMETKIKPPSISKINNIFDLPKLKSTNLPSKEYVTSRANAITRYRCISKSTNAVTDAFSLNRVRSENEVSRKAEHFVGTSFRTRSVWDIERGERKSTIAFNGHGGTDMRFPTTRSNQRMTYQPWCIKTAKESTKKNDLIDATDTTNPRAFFSSGHCGDRNYLFHMKKPASWKSSHLPNKGLHNHSHSSELPHILQSPTMDCLKETTKVLPRRKGETSSLHSLAEKEKDRSVEKNQQSENKNKENGHMNADVRANPKLLKRDQKQPNSQRLLQSKKSALGNVLSKAADTNMAPRSSAKKMSSYLDRIKTTPKKLPLKILPLELTSDDQPFNNSATTAKAIHQSVLDIPKRNETKLQPQVKATVSPSKPATNKLTFNPSDVTKCDLFQKKTETEKKQEEMNFIFNERDGIRNVNSCAQKEVKSTMEATENNGVRKKPSEGGVVGTPADTSRASHIERLFREEPLARQSSKTIPVVEVVPLRNTKSAIVHLKNKEELTRRANDVASKHYQDERQRAIATSITNRRPLPEESKAPFKQFKTTNSSIPSINVDKSDKKFPRLEQGLSRNSAKEIKSVSIPLSSGVSRVGMKRNTEGLRPGHGNQPLQLPSYGKINTEAFYRKSAMSEHQRMIRRPNGKTQSPQEKPTKKAATHNKIEFSSSERLIKTALALPKTKWKKSCVVTSQSESQPHQKPLRPVTVSQGRNINSKVRQKPSTTYDGNAIRNFLENLMKEQQLSPSYMQALHPKAKVVRT